MHTSPSLFNESDAVPLAVVAGPPATTTCRRLRAFAEAGRVLQPRREPTKASKPRSDFDVACPRQRNAAALDELREGKRRSYRGERR